MALRVFKAEDAAELREHLLEVIPELEDVHEAVRAIEFAAGPMGWLGSSPEEWRRLHKAYHDYFRSVAADIARLRARLSKKRPHGQNLRPPGAEFDSMLAKIEDSARVEAEGWRPQTGLGRAPDERRDMLIAAIRSVYPPGAAKLSIGSHFEETVDMVLRFVGRGVENVHGLIIDALRREKARGPRRFWNNKF